MTNNKPNIKTCPVCGKQYEEGHACAIINIKSIWNAELQNIHLVIINDADYDIETGTFKPSTESDPIKLNGKITLTPNDEDDASSIYPFRDLPNVTFSWSLKPKCPYCQDTGLVTYPHTLNPNHEIICLGCDAYQKGSTNDQQ